MHRSWAFLRGYAWIPCPICKRRFGSHEWVPGNELWLTDRDSVAVCRDCVGEAERQNAEKGYPQIRPPATASGGMPTSDS